MYFKYKRILLSGVVGAFVALLGYSFVESEAKSAKSDSGQKEFSITVDYSRPLGQSVFAGHYQRIDKSITEANFPSSYKDEKGKEQVEFKPFQFDHPVQYKEVIDRMGKEHHRPANWEELLRFGEVNSKLKRQVQLYVGSNAVLAIGSFYDNSYGNRYAIGICGNFLGERQLDVLLVDDQIGGNRMGEDCCFLGVRIKE